MRSSKIMMALVPIAAALCLGMGSVRTVFADAQTDELKAQVKLLNERIVQLEEQLARQKAPGAPHATVSPAALDDEWDPFVEMQRMRSLMNRLFQDSFDRGFGPGQSNWMDPQIDIKQAADQYVISMDLPGMEKDKINVEVKNGMLIVSGDRNSQSEVNRGGKIYRQERSYGHFLRSFPLPDDAKPDDVKAEYKNGVLEIKVGRIAADKPGNASGKKILIK